MKESAKGEREEGEDATKSNFFEEQAIGRWEFIILLGLIMGLSSLCIDTVLPALSPMKEELGVESDNKMQWIISVLFLGLAIGQLFYGTLSDSFGRRIPMCAGFALLFVGTALSFFAQSLDVLLVARFLQGIGLASPRTLSLAIVRDQFKGDKMAKIMSFVRAIFMLIPAFAPALGQLIVNLTTWRIIFVVIGVLSALLLLWFLIRMPETLEKEDRITLSRSQFKESLTKVWKEKDALAYTLMAGLVTGAFLGFLNCSQQILQAQYDLGKQFAFYIGGLSAFMGLASFINGWLVQHFGMRPLVLVALSTVLLWSLVFVGGLLLGGWELSLWSALTYLAGALFCTGILFGNMNSLALEPLGAVAGLGSTLVGASATLIGTGFGTLISMQYKDDILPVVVGYVIAACLGLGLVTWGNYYRQQQEA